MAYKNLRLDFAENLKLRGLLTKNGYKGAYDIVEMLDDMAREFSEISSTVNELINGLYMLDKAVGNKAELNWDNIKTDLVIATEFGSKALIFLDGHRLSYDDIPEDADEDEVRTSHAISLLEKL